MRIGTQRTQEHNLDGFRRLGCWVHVKLQWGSLMCQVEATAVTLMCMPNTCDCHASGSLMSEMSPLFYWMLYDTWCALLVYQCIRSLSWQSSRYASDFLGILQNKLSNYKSSLCHYQPPLGHFSPFTSLKTDAALPPPCPRPRRCGPCCSGQLAHRHDCPFGAT